VVELYATHGSQFLVPMCDEHMSRDQVELCKIGSKRDACGYKACPFHIE
jgi:hypothetical protein